MMKICTYIIIVLMSFCSSVFAQNVNYLQRRADRGDVSSQFNLALCYFYGQNVRQDLQKAVFLFEKAANNGLAEAQVMLGNCYVEGKGIEKDSVKAFELYNQAAWCESSMGLYSLGNAYYYGIGTPRDVIRARYYYNKAAVKGNKEAKKRYQQIRFEKD